MQNISIKSFAFLKLFSEHYATLESLKDNCTGRIVAAIVMLIKMTQCEICMSKYMYVDLNLYYTYRQMRI